MKSVLTFRERHPAAVGAIGLAILVLLFRNRSTINVAEIDSMKG